MTADDIKRKTQEFLSDKRHSNNLVDIIAGLLSDENRVVTASINATNQVFCHLLQTSTVLTDTCDETVQEAIGKYNDWLRDRFVDAQNGLLDMLSTGQTKHRLLCLDTLMKWIELEANCKKPGEHHVPHAKLERVVYALLSSDVDMKDVVDKFGEYMKLADVKTFTLKFLLKATKEWKRSPPNEQYLKNMYCLIRNIDIAQRPPSDKVPVPVLGGEKVFVVNAEQDVKRISAVWISFIAQKLPVKLYKELLILLPDKIIPHLHNPLLVADFFIESYNRGGALSLMALNGLFILIHKYHLDYPNFYEKLYALLVPDVFYQKYRARFFFLMDLFLSSTHIPAYLVAAFAKRLARLALTAPSYGLQYVIPFIGNLMIRHKGLDFLINSDGEEDMKTDPYDENEPDPAKCRATESCLWELKTLQSHWHPDIAKKARFIENPLQRVECDISQTLEDGYREMMLKAKKKKYKEAPVNFHQPTGILQQKEECLSQLWDLE
uniref:Putative nucleolar complex protein n=1 Tax=Ornithodoros turicata TaxID=34597 RepID=A0A2R5LK37_9ACAR